MFQLKVGITGASGFIGKHLIHRLRVRGHKAVVLTRVGGGRLQATVSTRPFPADGPPDLRGLDAVVNLAGESILGWWTKGKRGRIIASRVGTTSRLVDGLRSLPTGKGPRILVNASAVGYYGDRADTVLDEHAPAGTGFLAEVCQQWEQMAQSAERVGTRVARLRFGVVLGEDGGSFPIQRRLFGSGLGGRLGAGRQWTSPIHVDDVTGLIVHLLERDDLSGAFNAACPHPVRNADFTAALGGTLHKRAVLPVPALALRTLLGDASHIVLDSVRAVPARALDSGYNFRFPTLKTMLADLCAPAVQAGGSQTAS